MAPVRNRQVQINTYAVLIEPYVRVVLIRPTRSIQMAEDLAPIVYSPWLKIIEVRRGGHQGNRETGQSQLCRGVWGEQARQANHYCKCLVTTIWGHRMSSILIC